jgi:hypothetical protein
MFTVRLSKRKADSTIALQKGFWKLAKAPGAAAFAALAALKDGYDGLPYFCIEAPAPHHIKTGQKTIL